jgi:hypothetical protein
MEPCGDALGRRRGFGFDCSMRPSRMTNWWASEAAVVATTRVTPACRFQLLGRSACLNCSRGRAPCLPARPACGKRLDEFAYCFVREQAQLHFWLSATRNDCSVVLLCFDTNTNSGVEAEEAMFFFFIFIYALRPVLIPHWPLVYRSL